jgi:hypothetical protein
MLKLIAEDGTVLMEVAGETKVSWDIETRDGATWNDTTRATNPAWVAYPQTTAPRPATPAEIQERLTRLQEEMDRVLGRRPVTEADAFATHALNHAMHVARREDEIPLREITANMRFTAADIARTPETGRGAFIRAVEDHVRAQQMTAEHAEYRRRAEELREPLPLVADPEDDIPW